MARSKKVTKKPKKSTRSVQASTKKKKRSLKPRREVVRRVAQTAELPNIEELFSQSLKKDQGRDLRSQERISIGDLVRPYVTFGPGVLTPVELVDVSGTGCAIRFAFRQGIPSPSPKDLLELRFYFTPNAYLSVEARVANLSYFEVDGARWMRIGLKLRTACAGYAVFEKFVQFAKLFAKKAVRTQATRAAPLILT